MKKQTVLDEVYNYLETHPLARERKNRYKALMAIIRRKYNLPLPGNPDSKIELTNDKIEGIISDGMTYNRYINRVQQLNKELRGTDYEENKHILEQQAQVDLEYAPGYNEDIKLSKKI
jgi:hypothetical protein